MSGFNGKVIGETIKRYRTENQVTQMELAVKVGTTPDSISKYENGSISPTADRLWNLAKAMGCTPNDLLGWK